MTTSGDERREGGRVRGGVVVAVVFGVLVWFGVFWCVLVCLGCVLVCFGVFGGSGVRSCQAGWTRVREKKKKRKNGGSTPKKKFYK